MRSRLKANGPDRTYGPSSPPRMSRSLLLFDVVSSLSDTMRRELYHRPVSNTSNLHADLQCSPVLGRDKKIKSAVGVSSLV